MVHQIVRGKDVIDKDIVNIGNLSEVAETDLIGVFHLNAVDGYLKFDYNNRRPFLIIENEKIFLWERRLRDSTVHELRYVDISNITKSMTNKGGYNLDKFEIVFKNHTQLNLITDHSEDVSIIFRILNEKMNQTDFIDEDQQKSVFLNTFEKLIKRSDSIEINRFAGILKISEDDLLLWLLDLPEKYGFRIKENILVFDRESIDQNIDALLENFANFENTGFGKDRSL